MGNFYTIYAVVAMFFSHKSFSVGKISPQILPFGEKKDKYQVWMEGSGLPQLSMSAWKEEKSEQTIWIKYQRVCLSIYEQSLMAVLWCNRINDGGDIVILTRC